MKNLPIFCFFLLQLFCFQLKAQDRIRTSIAADSIPSLKFFMDSALLHSPVIKMYDTKIVQNQCELNLLKYSWMKEIYMTVDSKYGQYGNGQPSDQMSLGYGAGAVIKIPITVFAGQSQRKKIAEMQLDESSFQKDAIVSELKKALIQQYNETVYKRDAISIRVQSLESASLNYQLAEKEFKAGVIQIDQYSAVSEIYYSQLQKLEEAKMELRTALSILLEMSGIN